jgi:hypothetical protein
MHWGYSSLATRRLAEGKQRLWFIAALAIGLAAYAIALHQAYTWRGNTHPDFFVEWTATRVALEGGNPYAEQTTLAIQMGSKGELVPEGQDQLAFSHPYYRIFLSAPLAFLPYDWATAIWQTAMQAALLAGVLLFVRSLEWKPSPVEMVLVLMPALLAYPAFGGLMLGQMAIGVLAALLIAFWALHGKRDHLAGCCLALGMVRPQMAILAVSFLLLWSIFRRRWRVLLAFVLTMGILAGLSFLAFPAWLGEFVDAVLRYPSYKDVQTGPGYLLSGCCGQVWPWIMEALAAAWLLAGWWLAWRKDGPTEQQSAGNTPWLEGAFTLSLALSAFLLPQTSIVNQVVLLPAVLLLMRDISSWVARIALVVLAIGGSWIAFTALYNTHYALNMALPPLIVLLALAAWYLVEVRKNGKRSAER